MTATLLALLVAAGCAAGMGKETSQRETVPVAEFTVDADAVFEDAFAPNRLRAVDPCAALRSAGLDQYGEPASDTPGDLGSCSNFMKDHAASSSTHRCTWTTRSTTSTPIASAVCRAR
ncbi:hypothetical protein [Saccharopolyspora gloriosae]|uniref:hypothetical protein n=1 Tax=Saccharopolyspora gloriosae TaxID=455344 RepID=UPI001FB7A710|nr:hypothetical protein [Saccharopolyspora gloriosae]